MRMGNVGAEPSSKDPQECSRQDSLCSEPRGSLRSGPTPAFSCDQGDAAWAGDSIFTHVCHQQGHAPQHLAWREEGRSGPVAVTLFQWQSRSGKLIKLIIQTSKRQE